MADFPPVLLVVATMTAPPVQLDLFDPPAPLSAPASAPERRKGTTTRPGALRAADGAGAHESGAIPARCPVVGKPVCYFADCRHWQGGSCAHPDAADKPRPRRRR